MPVSTVVGMLLPILLFIADFCLLLLMKSFIMGESSRLLFVLENMDVVGVGKFIRSLFMLLIVCFSKLYVHLHVVVGFSLV